MRKFYLGFVEENFWESCPGVSNWNILALEICSLGVWAVKLFAGKFWGFGKARFEILGKGRVLGHPVLMNIYKIFSKCYNV